MPTSLFSDIDRSVSAGAGTLEEQRALQLAFELSMLSLEGTQGCTGNGGSGPGNGNSNDPSDLQATPSSVFEEARSKKSQNMTECVPVPSSEHVAEIVGRQGEYSSYFLCHSFYSPVSCTFLFLLPNGGYHSTKWRQKFLNI